MYLENFFKISILGRHLQLEITVYRKFKKTNNIRTSSILFITYMYIVVIVYRKISLEVMTFCLYIVKAPCLNC